MAQIKLISLNIERDMHYDTALPFLRREFADVVCLQEILERDLPHFEEALGMKGMYISTSYADKGRHTGALAQEGVQTGNALFTKLPKQQEGVLYYYGSPDVVPKVTDPLPQGRDDHSRGVVLWARVTSGEHSFTIGTVHFTWTPEGHIVSLAQRQDIEVLLAKLKEFPDFILCGDFNAPRGLPIWEKLAERYADNIPPEYTTSIDQKLHLKSGIMYVVDGLFSSPEYRVSDVRLVEGVSDHKAVVGIIERVG
ncbi:MAG: hypothetical protein EXS51_03440 [Candidatus Taylorbacteria bacterium]|nr:hypothetical protein [Candidatus Taylorbacteria bacterium]